MNHDADLDNALSFVVILELTGAMQTLVLHMLAKAPDWAGLAN